MNLASLAAILINIIAPIILVAGGGYLLAKHIGLEARPLSRTMLYFFIPALVFAATYQAKLSVEYISIAAFTVMITGVMVVVSWSLARVMRYDRLTSVALMLGIVFVNAGNYGLPLTLFAFGEEGLTRATFYFTTSAILTQTLGIFVAASGHTHARDALVSVFKLTILLGLFT